MSVDSDCRSLSSSSDDSVLRRTSSLKITRVNSPRKVASRAITSLFTTRESSPVQSASGTPVKKTSASHLIRCRLAGLAKKKHSCPSLHQTYNNAVTSPPFNQVEGASLSWIKNETGGVGGSPPCTSKSHSCPSFLCPPRKAGVRFKLIHQGQVQVCRLQHPRTVIGKLSSSKLLRRWETHTLVLASDEIQSTTLTGFMDTSVDYSTIEDMHAMSHLDTNDKLCIRIYIPEGSLLLHTNHAHVRDQWLHSIHWRRYLFRSRRIIESTNRPEVLLAELKRLVEHTEQCPLEDELIFLEPVRIACGVLNNVHEGALPRTVMEPVICCVAPLLETLPTVAEICPWLSLICHTCPRSRLIDDVFVPVAHNTLKKNMDFGKFPMARCFVLNTLLALFAQNGGAERIANFVHRVHGPASTCPHPPVVKNLISGCLAAIHSVFEPSSACYNTPKSVPLTGRVFNFPPTLMQQIDSYSHNNNLKLDCFSSAFLAICNLNDWRGNLASMLQPLPFPEAAFTDESFAVNFRPIIRLIGTDPRCEVHSTVIGVREGKEGWFHLTCPGGPSCIDDGQLYAVLLETLLQCCCRRKWFLQMLNSMIGPLQLLALREIEPAMDAMCSMLEMQVVEGEDMKLQIITALQSTSLGKQHYSRLCDRQIALRELQSKGGPRKLSLPSKSTDGDLAVLLSSGSFGNLEWLSLAFTNVTSACADYLIKLPSLRYLNLWSTQFGDLGVQMISEHLHRLQVLNLCETPCTDKGLQSLQGLKNLRKLNLCSTRLSCETLHAIKLALPSLQEVDVRYTDAWC